ncbi:MAG: peptide chain release factor 1 [candidate division WOR-3 bacterium]|nr:peptide chain release factor 1 [candidate division WOR-3 bacterium]
MRIEKLKEKIERFREIEKQLTDPEVINNNELYRNLSMEYAELKDTVVLIEKLLDIDRQLEENKGIVESTDDSELKEMAKEDIRQLKKEAHELEEKIKILLIPSDPNDRRDIIFEIRAGTGGDEAALFASDLFRMYKRYAESKNLSVELMDSHSTGLGGFRDITFSVKGKNSYRYFKFESGAHRVQRVPETESGGRIHTSAVTVAVLPEAENVEVELNDNDMKIDTFHASGAGGQNVNNVATAVRITHKPSDIVVSCQDERSQHKNKEKAKRILKARLYDMQMQKQQQEISRNRKSQVGSGDRSERIRTYNFPEGRVTDHRINLTIYRLDEILDGSLDMIIEELRKEEKKEKLEYVLAEEMGQ